ncbi:MAG TPA: putative manganese transporter, partial [Candidatus Krumholzibacterium sp.]|nr:putative manganese transporter [Candidatus Krumholzibacterium sp.]
MLDVLRNTLMITGFVFVMMLVIEFVNVLTSGAWQKRLASSRFGQYLLAALLGAVPGCLGSFAVVAMYSHRVLTFGAVVTAMIATSGDEAFVMLALIPRQAVIITGILFLTGIVAGMASDFFLKKTGRTADYRCGKMVVHDEHAGRYVDTSQLVSQWRHCTAARGVLTLGLVLLIIGIATGQVGHTGHGEEKGADSELVAGIESEADHDHEAEHDLPSESVEAGHTGHGHGEGWDWVRITMLVTSIVALAIVATVSDHFLEEHLWDHIARRHLPRVFLWTL